MLKTSERRGSNLVLTPGFLSSMKLIPLIRLTSFSEPRTCGKFSVATLRFGLIGPHPVELGDRLWSKSGVVGLLDDSTWVSLFMEASGNQAISELMKCVVSASGPFRCKSFVDILVLSSLGSSVLGRSGDDTTASNVPSHLVPR